MFECDREACFKWFSKIMGDVPDLDPEIYKEFFDNNVLQFDPAQLTESGMKYVSNYFTPFDISFYLSCLKSTQFWRSLLDKNKVLLF